MKNREKKKREKQRCLEHRRLERKRQLECVLAALGLLGGYRTLQVRE